MNTVADLIAELQKLPQDLVVVQSSDGEGNHFHGWYDISIGTWDDEYDEFSSLTIDVPGDYSTEREVTIDEATAICLWPDG